MCQRKHQTCQTISEKRERSYGETEPSSITASLSLLKSFFFPASSWFSPEVVIGVRTSPREGERGSLGICCSLRGVLLNSAEGERGSPHPLAPPEEGESLGESEGQRKGCSYEDTFPMSVRIQILLIQQSASRSNIKQDGGRGGRGRVG